jgi:hypothetical protein
MTKFGFVWTVVINNLPYEARALKPWVAVQKALKQYCDEHPHCSMLLFDIYLTNKTFALEAEKKERK